MAEEKETPHNVEKGEETPKVETPKVETPKAEEPKVETPKVEPAKAEAPKTETPKVETPKVEPAKAETPKAEASKAETPKAKEPKVEPPKDEAPKVETPKVKPAKAEAPKVKKPKADAPAGETPKDEKPKAKAPSGETPEKDAETEAEAAPETVGGVPKAPTAKDLLKDEIGAIKVRKAKGSKNISSGVVHIAATFNNTIVSITDQKGNLISWSSGGKMNFRGSRKSTAYAAQIVAQDAARAAMSHGLKEVVIRVKGPGMGRDSAIRAMQAVGLEITSIVDVTPVPHNGCRPPKRRRV